MPYRRFSPRALVVGAALAISLSIAPVALAALPGVASGVYASRGDAGPLAAVGAKWTYNWSPNISLPPTSSVEAVPMVWGGTVDAQTIAQLTEAHRTGRATYLLGFNEPDNGGQANMTPSQALAQWPGLESTGLKLISPAPASIWTPSQENSSKSWLDDFMQRAQAQNLRVDGIALHEYYDYTDPDSVSWIQRDIEVVHEKYPTKPIWVTEMGTLPTWTWSGSAPHATPTPQLAQQYMRKLIAMLDSLPYVARYAWFMDQCDGDCASASLYDSSDRLNDLGHTFAQITGANPVAGPATARRSTIAPVKAGRTIKKKTTRAAR
jgi:Glycosyl hydrolase catalytic core